MDLSASAFPRPEDTTKVEEKWATDILAGFASSMNLTTLQIESRIILVDDWCRVGIWGLSSPRAGWAKPGSPCTWPMG